MIKVGEYVTIKEIKNCWVVKIANISKNGIQGYYNHIGFPSMKDVAEFPFYLAEWIRPATKKEIEFAKGGEA